MGILSEIFVWWGGNTWGNRWDIWRHGAYVGSDAEGNRYYQQKSGVGPLGLPRRWVVYRNYAEASKIPPEWHAWMHQNATEPPTREDYQPRPWEKSHRENMTGTSEAYRPPGSAGRRAASTSDYEPWTPS